ncbi:hypothetical protein J2X04_001363 [Lysobacter niabensis]|uniref:DnrO protein n=1 Tax=Agrilutibacter niabensis TaxID=380628 RepID=A0ABU1VNF1_9GAMM|nr:DnrO protein [Lysobacter niabensis]MDR7099016.1 hypothetical protein [Lysobacter niabensis]
MRNLLLPLALLCAAFPAFAHDDHARDATTAAAPEAAAPRWATDAPLRAGMRGIRVAVDALGHYEHGHMGPEQATVLANEIEGHVQSIITNCKLAPEADAALHAIIVPLLQNARALKADPTKLQVIPPMREALADYARRFEDPEFANANGGR